VSIGTAHSADEPEHDEEQRPGTKWKLALAALIGTFVALACYELVSFSTGAVSAPGAVASQQSHQARAPATPRATALVPTPAPAVTPASHALTVASVVAFGPDGTSDGDNPGVVSRIGAVSETQPWYSDWYTTPEFGGGQAGTGILLDMGKAVTVTSVRLELGTTPGADFQVRVGDTQTLAGLPSVASTSDAAGTVRLRLTSRVKGRYVLIWFTRLPPNGQGEYQVSVYSITVDGTAGA
jgi:hypothetical protein